MDSCTIEYHVPTLMGKMDGWTDGRGSIWSCSSVYHTPLHVQERIIDQLQLQIAPASRLHLGRQSGREGEGGVG